MKKDNVTIAIIIITLVCLLLAFLVADKYYFHLIDYGKPASETAAPEETAAPAEKSDKTVIYTDRDTSGVIESLGKYKGLEIERNYEVDDTAIYSDFSQTEIAIATDLDPEDNTKPSVYAENLLSKKITDRAVKKFDTVSFDYKGTKDGVAFEGGTAENSNLLIGSGSFIPGFEDQMIGRNCNETFTIKVTFPENYGATDLAGKEVEFEILIHYIYPELNDETIAIFNEFLKYFDGEAYVQNYSNVEEYLVYTAAYLTDQMEKSFQQSLPSLIMDKVYAATKFKTVPQAEIDAQIKQNTDTAESYGLDFATYLSYMGFSSEEQFKEYVKMNVSIDYILAKIAKDEKMIISADEYNEQAKILAESNEFGSVEELESYVSEDKTEAKAIITNAIISQKIQDLLVSENKVVDKK